VRGQLAIVVEDVVGDVAEGADGRPRPTHDTSPARGCPSRLRLAVLPQPLLDIADEVPDLSPDVNRARPPAGQAPVVQRPDRHVEVLRELLDAHQRLQAAQDRRGAVHAG